MKLGVHKLVAEDKHKVRYITTIPTQPPDYCPPIHVDTYLTEDEKFKLLCLLVDISRDRKEREVDMRYGERQ